ncbi:MAG: L,D-transpeptidase [Anaerolineae bacterium]|nr:L,D-transpeptidase [Anaerolineae bacterium]
MRSGRPAYMPVLILALLMALVGSSAVAADSGKDSRPPGQANGGDMPAAFGAWERVMVQTWTYDEPDGRRRLRLSAWNTWLSVVETRQVGETVWARVGSGEWLDYDDLSAFPITGLRGYQAPRNEPGGLGFIIDPETATYDAPNTNGAMAATLDRYTPVALLGTDAGWWRIGPGQWVNPAHVREVQRVARPADVGPSDKWIDVNLTQQTVAAYEGDRLVFATLMSSGKDPTPTKEGLFYIYEKKIGEFMAGGWQDQDPYWLEEVPWTMYFSASYALHGAYWHDKFGDVLSHGCVNLSPDDAKFLFTWSGPVVSPDKNRVLASPDNLGTWVYVHP